MGEDSDATSSVRRVNLSTLNSVRRRCWCGGSWCRSCHSNRCRGRGESGLMRGLSISSCCGYSGETGECDTLLLLLLLNLLLLLSGGCQVLLVLKLLLVV